MAQRSTSRQFGYLARRGSPIAARGDGEDVSVRQRRLAEHVSARMLRGEQRVIARSDPTSLARPCAIAPLPMGLLAPGGGAMRPAADRRSARV